MLKGVVDMGNNPYNILEVISFDVYTVFYIMVLIWDLYVGSTAEQ